MVRYFPGRVVTDYLLPPRTAILIALQRSCFSSRWLGWRAGNLLAGARGWGHGGLLPVATMHGGLLEAEVWHDVVGPWRRWRRGESRGTCKLLPGKRCTCAIELLAGRGCRERVIQARAGSRPLELGEDTLLLPVVACRFSVGEWDARVAWCNDGDARTISGEGGLSANFTLYRRNESPCTTLR
jgi:hypothetical protein